MLPGYLLITFTALLAIVTVAADTVLGRGWPSRLAMTGIFAVICMAGMTTIELAEIGSTRGRDLARIAALESQIASGLAVASSHVEPAMDDGDAGVAIDGPEPHDRRNEVAAVENPHLEGSVFADRVRGLDPARDAAELVTICNAVGLAGPATAGLVTARADSPPAAADAGRAERAAAEAVVPIAVAEDEATVPSPADNADAAKRLAAADAVVTSATDGCVVLGPQPAWAAADAADCDCSASADSATQGSAGDASAAVTQAVAFDDDVIGRGRRRRSDEPPEVRRISLGGRMWKLAPVAHTLLRDGSTEILSVESGTRGLVVSALLRSASGRTIARMERNEWVQNAHGSFDRNLTPDVVEVVDGTGKVVFQVVRSGGVVSVEGILPCRNGRTVQLMHGPTRGQAVFAVSPADMPAMLSIPPLCSYPSEQRLGDCPTIGGHKRLLDWYVPAAGGELREPAPRRWTGALDLCNGSGEVALSRR